MHCLNLNQCCTKQLILFHICWSSRLPWAKLLSGSTVGSFVEKAEERISVFTKGPTGNTLLGNNPFMGHLFQNMKLFNNSSNYTSGRSFPWDGRFVFRFFFFWFQCCQKNIFQWTHVFLFCVLKHILSLLLTASQLPHFVLIITTEKKNSFKIIP